MVVEETWIFRAEVPWDIVGKKVKEKAIEELTVLESTLPNQPPPRRLPVLPTHTFTRTKMCPRMGHLGTVVSHIERFEEALK